MFKTFSLVLALSASAAVATQAQTVTQRNSDFFVSFTDLSFAGADAAYSIRYILPKQAAFSDTFTTTLYSNYRNLVFHDSGGITYTPAVVPPGTTTIPGTLKGNGKFGTFGLQYDTAATAGGDLLTLGRSGNLRTLNFTGGGSTTGFGVFPFYIKVTLPGDWSVSGAATGDHTFNGIGPGFTLVDNFVYHVHSNTTVITAEDRAYASGGVSNLNFTLYGAPVPEPATWTFLLGGAALAGMSLRRRRRPIGAAA